jgi:hypothetical protein
MRPGLITDDFDMRERLPGLDNIKELSLDEHYMTA